VALLDSDHIRQTSGSDKKTNHPGVCLGGFFVVLLGAFLLVHIAFNAFI